jgi:hypothetical protein
MTLLAGDAECTIGMAAAILAAREELGSTIKLTPDKTALKADCYALAKAIVAYIQANATVTVAPGIAVSTAGTAAAQTGATTATGTGTVS